MILLKLFLTFLEIGAVSFGGGYGMISLLSEKVTENGWMTEEEFLNFVAVAESTPGPIAVNMATFVGAGQAGFPGALIATFGVILPAFLILLLICLAAKNLMKRPAVGAFLGGVRPAVVGLILATGLTMLIRQCADFGENANFSFHFLEFFFFLGVVAVALLLKKLLKRSPSPILLLLLAAAAGIGVGYLFHL